MSASNFVKLDGLSLDATARDVEEFMMYCGRTRTIELIADATSETGQSAIVEFKNSDSVELAQLLSGAVFYHHEIHIRPMNDRMQNADTEGGETTTAVPGRNRPENNKPPSLLRSAMEVIEKLQVRKILSKSSKLLNHLRQEAKEVSYGISSATVELIDRIGNNNAPVRTNATLEQWDYMSTQPQWGRNPSLGGN